MTGVATWDFLGKLVSCPPRPSRGHGQIFCGAQATDRVARLEWGRAHLVFCPWPPGSAADEGGRSAAGHRSARLYPDPRPCRHHRTVLDAVRIGSDRGSPARGRFDIVSDTRREPRSEICRAPVETLGPVASDPSVRAVRGRGDTLSTLCEPAGATAMTV